jgi:hypothetical protein
MDRCNEHQLLMYADTDGLHRPTLLIQHAAVCSAVLQPSILTAVDMFLADVSSCTATVAPASN